VASVTLEELAAEFPQGTSGLLKNVGGGSDFNYKQWVRDLLSGTSKTPVGV
jgi:hypothetical protein